MLIARNHLQQKDLSARKWLLQGSVLWFLLVCSACAMLSKSVFAQNTEQAQNQQQAAFGEVVYHYFQKDFQQVLLLTEVGIKQHNFIALSQDNQDRLALMQGAAQLQLGLYAQSQAKFARLLSQTTSDYVQAHTWYFMAKAGFDNKQSYLSERAYAAINQGDLREELSDAQWHELLYMTAYTRMQNAANLDPDESSDAPNTPSNTPSNTSADWQSLFADIPNTSIFSTYLLANHASNLFNKAEYEQSSKFFVDAKQALLAHQNAKGIITRIASSFFDFITTATTVITPWTWFDENAIAEQAQRNRQEAQDKAEQDALFDTINIGLGQSLLQQADFDNAVAVLQNVSANGVESQQALLTYGWANAKENRWTQAMAAWQHLQQNSVGLFALQASYGLAYAFGQQDNLGQAFFALRDTSRQIDTSLVALDSFNNSVQNEAFFNQYNQLWPQALSDLKLGFFAPTLSFDAKYLLSIRAQAQDILKDIQRKNMRIIQLEQMLQERAQSYAKRQQSLSLDSAQSRLQQAQDNINAIEALLQVSQDFESQLALSKKMASREVTAQVQRLDRAFARHTRLKNDTTRKRPLKASYQKRLQRVNGIVTWQLMDRFVAQKWQHQQLLMQAQSALSQAQHQYQKLQTIAQQQDAFNAQKSELLNLRNDLQQQTQFAEALYGQATNALTMRLTNLIAQRQAQLKQQGVNTRLAMLRIQDLQQGGRQ